MTCIKCQHQACKRFGYFGKRRIQRWRCTACKATFCEPHDKLTTRDTINSNPDFAAFAIKCLVEGCSIRSTERLTGLNRNTIMRLLLVAAERSARLMRHKLVKSSPVIFLEFYSLHKVGKLWCLESLTKSARDSFSRFAYGNCLRIQLVEYRSWVRVVLMN
jgi:transposase-like protein